ncbi:MAG: hypothetical protein SVM86_05170 [Candidatus Cloacimonadota bacterium]|nr:hypothetical protein [Candidatus Cloacimonadota bacterium]
MFYEEMLADLMNRKNTNPVNKMYLHEINIKWKNFAKLAESKEKPANEELVSALEEFINAISNKKYRYKPGSKNGFTKHSPIFSALYLADLITIFIERTGFFNNKGVSWGFQQFSKNICFDPSNLNTMHKDPGFCYEKSDPVLQLAQNLDFRVRPTGRRDMHKAQLVFPLITFHPFRNLTEQDFERCQTYANEAKKTFAKSKTIVICETVQEKFIPELKYSSIDVIFVLRKQFMRKKINKIDPGVLYIFEKKLNSYLFEEESLSEQFQNKGYLE